MEKHQADMYVLTGRTGSGLSTAKRVFERNGFLISYPRLSTFKPENYGSGRKHLVVIDVNTAIADNVKEKDLIKYYQEFEAKLSKIFKIIYLDADDAVLFRRQHKDQIPPLYTKLFNYPWMKAFGVERKVISSLYENAYYLLDTSQTTSEDLAKALDFLINLKIPGKYMVSSYNQMLYTLFHEDFWSNIGNNMSIFREIAVQPEIAKHFLQTYQKKIEEPIAKDNIIKQLKQAKRIVLTGMGSSYFAGSAVKEILQKCYRIALPVDCIPLSELTFGDLKDVLLIISSNSGETGEIKECYQKNLFKDVLGIFGITNYENSFLANKCKEGENNILFTLDAPKEESIPATVSVTSNLLILSGILSKIQDIVDKQHNTADTLLKDIDHLPSILKELLSQGSMNQIYSIATKMSEHLVDGTGYVVGCGALTSILNEVALKGIELAKLYLSPLPHSFAHGPLNASAMEGVIYLQDSLTNKEVIVNHLEKLIQHCPVFAVGPYWDIHLPNLYTLACNADNPTVSIFSQLMVLQLFFATFGLITGLSPNEICQPSMLNKVVLSSPIS